MIRIRSQIGGFRRCGVAHPAAATDHPDDQFSKKQLEVLKAEPMLVVEEIAGNTSQAGQKNSTSRPNVGDTIALVQAVTTVEELEKFVEGEERKGVQDAIAKRRTELTPAPAAE